MRIHRVRSNEFKKEYGIRCQRVYSDDHTDTPFGATWCLIDPLQRTTPHSHEDGETFFIIAGRGLMTIGEEREEVVAGDVVFIPPHSEHFLMNVAADKPLQFISVYWLEEVAAAPSLVAQSQAGAV